MFHGNRARASSTFLGCSERGVALITTQGRETVLSDSEMERAWLVVL